MGHSEQDPIRIFLVAEHDGLRRNLEMLLKDEGIEVSRWAGGAEAALRELKAGADIMVLGLSGGGEGACDLLREVGSREDTLPCIVLSADDDERSIEEAYAAGARGYVTNREAPEKLVPEIREVAAGRDGVAHWKHRPA